MRSAFAHDHANSLDFLDVVQFLFDGDWLELRISPAGAISRATNVHSHRARWVRFVRASPGALSHALTRD